MIFILDDFLEIGAHVERVTGNLTYLRHLFRLTADANLKFY